jgi:hypothetical protein
MSATITGWDTERQRTDSLALFLLGFAEFRLGFAEPVAPRYEEPLRAIKTVDSLTRAICGGKPNLRPQLIVVVRQKN